MKLPRGVSGERLVRALEQLGYSVIRQKGSHTRMRHEGLRFIRSLFRPHNPLKTGTLHGILSEVAQTRSMTVDALAAILFS